MSSAAEMEVVPHRERLPDGKFPQGVSGNPGGRPKDPDALIPLLRKELDKYHPLELRLAAKEGREPRTNREVIVHRLVARAMSGDLKGIEAVLNRIDGKPRTKVEVSGEVDHVHDHDTKSATMRELFGRIALLRPAPAPPE